MAKQRNMFIKGVVDDLHPSHVQPDNWVFPVNNIRIYNKRGQGFVVSSQLGNEQLFEITDGYSIVAAVENRGIVYIVSSNDINTEIGTYPTPKSWYKDVDGVPIIQDPVLPKETGFINYYGALRNYKDGSLEKMNTPLFGYKKDSNVKLIVDSAFDESANLYLCDGENIDKVVNSGFKVDGSLNGRSYEANDFEGELNHILFSVKPPFSNLLSVSPGGNLKPGNYFLYYRYETSTFDRTRYYPCTFPISISEGTQSTNIQGTSNLSENLSQKYTSKRMMIELTNLDKAFTYIRIGVIRYYSDESGAILNDVYQIATRYSILNIIESDNKIVISGNEPEEILTRDEIFETYIKERISTDHIISNQRMFKSNLKKLGVNKKGFAEFAKLITITEEIFPLDDNSYNDIINKGIKESFAYMDPTVTESNLGYLPGETYPFSVGFYLNDGTYSEAYPITGSDGMGFVGTNNKGLYRFGFTQNYGAIKPKFNIAAAIAYRDMNEKLFKDVKGFYILRGNRLGNFICEGYFCETIYAVEDQSPSGSVDPWYFMSENEEGAFYLPVTASPRGITSGDFPVAETDQSIPRYEYTGNKGRKKKRRFAVFSPDVMFQPYFDISNGLSVSIYVHSPSSYGSIDQHEFDRDLLMQPSIYRTDHNIINRNILNPISAKAYFISKGTYKGAGQFSSYVEDGFEISALSAYREKDGDKIYYNRSYTTPSYLGILTDQDYYFNDNIDHVPKSYIATVYKTFPDKQSIETEILAFNVATTQYWSLSEYNDFTSNSEVITSKGDNFEQRIFIRMARTVAQDINASGKDFRNVLYNYGKLVSYKCASTLNSSLRNFIYAAANENTQLFSFFPSNVIIYPNPADWIYKSNDESVLVESMQMNHGYNKTSQDIVIIGADKQLPEDSNIKSTRIAFSSKYIAEAFFDNYRDIKANSYQDYSTNNGAIQRIENVLDILVSIRDRSIEQHFVGQKKQQASEEEVVLSPVGIYLSDETSLIANYGIQNFHSIVSSRNGLYGVDEMSELLWRLAVSYTDYGRRKPQFELMSRQMSIEKIVKEYIEKLSKETISPLVMDGVSMGFNEDFGEVYWTFLNKEIKDFDFYWFEARSINSNGWGDSVLNVYLDGILEKELSVDAGYVGSGFSAEVGDGVIIRFEYLSNGNPDSGNHYYQLRKGWISNTDRELIFVEGRDPGDIPGDRTYFTGSSSFQKTIVFNESLGFFTGNSDVSSSIYIPYKKGYISALHASNTLANQIYIGDSESWPIAFYESRKDNVLSFIINGNVKEENSSTLTKIFEALELHSPNHPLLKITYETESQSGEYQFSHNGSAEFWKDSEWNEGIWHIPIIREVEDNKDEYYQQDSLFRGRWIKVSLYFKADKEFYISNIISKFNISFV